MPIVKKYKVKVVDILNPVENLYTVTFYSEKKFHFYPGQFLHLALDDYDGTGQWPESRCFSMQNKPGENKIKISFSVKGNFTTRMANELYEGKELWLKLPYGELFTQTHNKVNTVFIAGGTGITPFLSLFTDVSFNEYINPKIYLGFRSKKYNIYENELKEICNKTSKISIFFEDENGIIDIEKIFKENGTNSDYFISGPPIMIKSFKSFLINNGLPEQKVRTDEWE